MKFELPSGHVIDLAQVWRISPVIDAESYFVLKVERRDSESVYEFRLSSYEPFKNRAEAKRIAEEIRARLIAAWSK